MLYVLGTLLIVCDVTRYLINIQVGSFRKCGFLRLAFTLLPQCQTKTLINPYLPYHCPNAMATTTVGTQCDRLLTLTLILSSIVKMGMGSYCAIMTVVHLHMTMSSYMITINIGDCLYGSARLRSNLNLVLFVCNIYSCKRHGEWHTIPSVPAAV